MTDSIQEHLAHNLALVEQRISSACERSGRQRAEVTLIAVSKTRSIEEILAANTCGVRHFGENRVEELVIKVPALAEQCLSEPPVWHMIGHLQSRKAREAVAHCSVLHSLDSLSLAGKLNNQAGQRVVSLPVLVECNVSQEPTKFGFAAWDEAAWPALANELSGLVGLTNLRVVGLMTMAPVVEHPEQARPHFRKLRALREYLRRVVPGINWQELSMGMSDDFSVAIEEGATMVRIGRAIFQRGQVV